MSFQRIAIWGLGLMGGSLAAALKARGHPSQVIGISSPPSLEKARAADLVDEGFEHDRFAEAVAGCDLVVLASPIQTILDNLDRLGAVLEPGTVVTDVGSTKEVIVDRARRALGEGVIFVGSHPMAGSEARGIAAADAYLYENALWVLTPIEESPEVARLTALAEFVGSKVVVLDPARHDLIAARISHLPQTLAIALMNQAGDWHMEDDLTLRLAAGGFRDLTRIASSPYEMWRDIYATNREAVLDSLDDLIHRLLSIRTAVADGTLRGAFERANRLRLNVPRDTKGFQRPLQDVMVVVHDEPGVLAGIASSLAASSINIRDIEVLKVREGEGGTMRLAFDDIETAERAVKRLTDEGLRAWIRE